jgi:hypothetical protein
MYKNFGILLFDKNKEVNKKHTIVESQILQPIIFVL